MNVPLLPHFCPPKSLVPCNKAIEVIPEGTFVCPYSGRKFNLVLLASCYQAIGDDEIGGLETIPEEKTGGEGELLIINKKQEENIECVLQQMIEETEEDCQFPFEAYLMELERVYQLIIPKVTMSVEEYVVSTLYIMMEGFGKVCPDPNLFLKRYMPEKTTELKARGLQKHLITTGKSKWRDYLSNLEQKGGEKHTFFKLKKRKVEIEEEGGSIITIKNHIEIMKMYEKTRDMELLITL